MTRRLHLSRDGESGKDSAELSKAPDLMDQDSIHEELCH